jgi:hypothetical protein
VSIILTTENVSDDGKAQSIFSPHIKLVGQKIATDIQLFSPTAKSIMNMEILRLCLRFQFYSIGDI